MAFQQRLNVTFFTTISSFAFFSGTVAATPIVYTGSDSGSTSLAGSPNATSAAATFDLAAGVLSTIDFESGIPAGVSLSGGIVGDATAVCGTPDLHCYATSPINVLRNNGTAFEFASPINAFGTYFTGWQVTGQTITIGYSTGGTTVLAMPPGLRGGGTLFYGFTDVGTSITSITYFAGAPSSDAVGIDDVRFGTVVPTPSAIWLFSFGLLGLMGISRRIRAATFSA